MLNGLSLYCSSFTFCLSISHSAHCYCFGHCVFFGAVISWGAVGQFFANRCSSKCRSDTHAHTHTLAGFGFIVRKFLFILSNGLIFDVIFLSSLSPRHSPSIEFTSNRVPHSRLQHTPYNVRRIFEWRLFGHYMAMRRSMSGNLFNDKLICENGHQTIHLLTVIFGRTDGPINERTNARASVRLLAFLSVSVNCYSHLK